MDAALARLTHRLAREVVEHSDRLPGAGSREAAEEPEEPDDDDLHLGNILRSEESGRPHAAILAGTPILWHSPDAPPGFPVPSVTVEALRRGRPVVYTVTLQGRLWRVRAQIAGVLDGPAATQPLVIPAAVPLTGVRDSLAALLRVLVLAAAGGVVLAAGAGYLQAYRALRPIWEAMERQQLFTAGASHEMRTPLAVIRANAELLEAEPLPPEQQKWSTPSWRKPIASPG